MIPYSGNLTWLVPRTILLTRAGSHSYGTNIATSDEDYRGVAISPREVLHGFLNNFDQAVSKTPDLTIYDVRKFFRLAADGNPGILETMYVDNRDMLAVTAVGEKLLERRDDFLSKKIQHTFTGYAMSQLKRIRMHRRWLLNPPKGQPTRKDFGLPERTVIPADQLMAADAVIQKKLAEWESGYLDGVDPAGKVQIKAKMAEILADIHVNSVDDQYAPAARAIGLGDNFIAIALKEREYTAKLREWQQYKTWKTERNPVRAELEAQSGYDTKHGMHLVRLMRMCREILETGKVNVRRWDAEELLAIRNGAWSYETLIEWADREDAALHEVAKASKLPSAPDRVALDAQCADIVEEML